MILTALWCLTILSVYGVAAVALAVAGTAFLFRLTGWTRFPTHTKENPR